MFHLTHTGITQLSIIIIITVYCVSLSHQYCEDFDNLSDDILDEDEDFKKNIDRLRNACDEFPSMFDVYDAPGHQANGLRSFVGLIGKYFTKLVKIEAKRRSTYVSLVYGKQPILPNNVKNGANVLTSMLDIVHTMIDERQHPGKPSNALSVAHQLLDIDYNSLRAFMELDTFWLTPYMKMPLILYRTLHCLTLHRPMHFRIVEMPHAYDAAARFAVDGDVFQLKKIWHFWQTQATTDSSLLTHIETPPHYSHVISDNGTIESVYNYDQNERMIKSQVIRSGKPNGDIVIHAHGGGFVELHPLSHSPYLARWAEKLDGLTFITVDYRLSPEHKYPAALQDLLDVWTWLTDKSNTDHVREVLGFEPKRIVLFGDSAGGNLGLALLRILGRIGGQLPDGLYFLYPHTTLTLTSMTKVSKVFMAIDAILPMSSFFSWTEAYAPGFYDYSSSKSWHRSSQLEQRIHEIETKSQTDDLFNPMLGDFDDFKDIPLLVACGDYDPLLDDSIELVKRWPGKAVELFIIKGQSHGFPLSIELSKVARHDIDACGQRLAELLNFDYR